jgi:hypothetical protein
MGGEGFAAAIDVVFVEVDGVGVAEFLEDGVGIGVGGFPAVIDGDHDGFGGDFLFAAFPGEEVIEGDDGQAELAEDFHLFAELGGPDAHGGLGFGFREVVIAEDGDADAVVCGGGFLDGGGGG